MTAMLHPRAILETVLYVDDLDDAAAFYRDVLRLVPVQGDDRMRVLKVSDENLLLLFLRGGTTTAIPVPGGVIPPHDGSGPLHLAFSVDRTDLAAWRAHLAKKGVSVESAVSWPNDEESLYFRDPSGNLVELATRGLWNRQRQPPAGSDQATD